MDGFKYGYSACFPDQLYDLSSDPHETINLGDSANHQDQLNKMRRKLSDWMSEHGDPVRGIYNQGMRYHRGETG